MMARRHREGGFTLLELLISLTLLGGLGVVMFGGLWYGLQTWHRASVFDERPGSSLSALSRQREITLGRDRPGAAARQTWDCIYWHADRDSISSADPAILGWWRHDTIPVTGDSEREGHRV